VQDIAHRPICSHSTKQLSIQSPLKRLQ